MEQHCLLMAAILLNKKEIFQAHLSSIFTEVGFLFEIKYRSYYFTNLVSIIIIKYYY